MKNEFYHHGILGQEWGVRNGPPYPLGGSDYSLREKRKIFKERKNKNSIYSKKHFDKIIDTKDTLTTLSYDPNRTKDTDMFYAAYNKLDKHQYNALFNKKAPQDIYDENGNVIGTGDYYKFRINNSVKNTIKVASEDAGADAFLNLYKTSRDFSNFVRDPDRMQSLFVKDKYKFKGYRQAARSLDKIRSMDMAKEEDLRTAYRMFNYVLPSDGSGNQRMAKDVLTQRARFFRELKNNGYGACLDTNDAIYGGFKTSSPVIVFDMKNIVLDSVKRVNDGDKMFSDLVTIGRKALGL